MSDELETRLGSGLAAGVDSGNVALGSRVDLACSACHLHGLTSYVLGFIGGRIIAGETITVETLEAAVCSGMTSLRRW